MGKTAVVTGGTSGIGLCTAVELIKKGCTVYEISRRDRNLGNGAIHISADVSDEAALSAAVKKIAEKEGGIDILINNAGFGISGAVEFTRLEDAKRLMDVNFFGTVNAVRAVLPLMREAGGGRIVNISSVAGVIPIPFQTYYSASKAAVNSYTQALISEVRPFNISVCAVLPGDTRTGFTDGREKSAAGDDTYMGRIGRSVSAMEKDERGGMTPEAVGRAIARIAVKKRVKPLYSVGIKYKLFTLLARIMPPALAVRIVGMLYAR